jgi:hypothetical protein
MLLSTVAALAAAAALAQDPQMEPDQPAFEEAADGEPVETRAAGEAPLPLMEAAPDPEPGDAHGDGTAPAVEAVDELDALSAGVEEEFPIIEEAPNRKPVSVTVRALDKITARYQDLAVKIGETAKFGSLEITPRHCDKRPPEEFPETTAFLEVFDRDASRARSAALVDAKPVTRVRGGKTEPPAGASPDAVPDAGMAAAMGSDVPSALDPDRIFAGWMFASSPALNPLEHPVYDVWVIDCKTVVASN